MFMKKLISFLMTPSRAVGGITIPVGKFGMR